MENLKGIEGNIGVSAKDSNIKLKSSAWNDSKISDHHAIIPTVEANSSKLKSLNHVEKGVFELIAKSFIAQFYSNHRYKSLSAIVDFNGDKFKATGKQVVDNGWKNVYQNEKQQDETDEDSQSLPSMSKNNPVEIEKVENKAKQTKPPARFSDGTLIAAMTNMHKFVTDLEIKKKLKENDGLGTEATRSSIIETLIKRNFLTRKGKKQIISTDTGRSVIDALPIEIVDPGLTAVWEGYLNSVSDGQIGPDKFMQGQIKTLRDRIEKGKLSEVKIKGKKIRPLDGHGETCNKCGEGTMITREINKGKNKGKRFLACDKYPDCENIKWEQEKIEPIKGHGETCNKCGEGTMTTRKINKGDNKGKKFLACDKYPECKNAVWPQPNVKPVEGDGKQCPSCENGKLVTRQSKNGNSFLACNAYPDCKHMEWPKSNIEKMEGDGKQCSKCKKGVMVTRKVNKGDNKGKTFLACNAYPECKNTIWDN
jgi:DNA topoisomerase-3